MSVMSVEYFIKLCTDRIQQKQPFVAYMHANGFALMRTAAGSYDEYTIQLPSRFGTMDYTTTDRAEYERYKAQGYKCRTEAKRLTVKKGSVTKMLSAIKKMRKDPTICGLCVVEFNGYVVQTEGHPALDVLQEVAV